MRPVELEGVAMTRDELIRIAQENIDRLDAVLREARQPLQLQAIEPELWEA